MAVDKENWPKTKNMFYKVLPDKYAEGFDKVYHADIEDRDEIMKSLNEEAQNDADLTSDQKIIVSSSYIAYCQATCLNTLSIPLIMYVKNEKPNLRKIVKNKTRLKRMFAHLQDFAPANHFDIDISSIYTDLTTLVKIATDDTFKLSIQEIGAYTVTCIDSYSKVLPEDDYPTKWYILCLLSFIIDFGAKIYNQDFASKNFERLRNLVKTVNFIIGVSYANEGRLEELKKELDIDGTEVSVVEEEKKEEQKEEGNTSEDSGTPTVRGQEPGVADDDVSMGKFKELDEQISKEKEGLNITEVEV